MRILTGHLKIATWLMVAIGWLYTVNLFGQIHFKVELLNDGITYQVSMLSDITWDPPLNITSTAQVAIRVPTGGFEPDNLNSLQSGTFWAQNARYNTPVESPGYDYISFGLTSLGTSGFDYQQDIEIPLFTFVNTGICTGPVEIMSNSDPFYPPNSLNANVNNQITTLGSGLGGNGFVGPYDLGQANCLIGASSDVSFELDQLADGTYQVAAVPNITWPSPLNFTDTLIATIKAPTGSFQLGGLTSLVQGAVFLQISTVISPSTNSTYDYFIIALNNSGSTGFTYNQGVKTPLFTFKNTGSCAGNSIELADFATDAYLLTSSGARMRLRTNGSGTGFYVNATGTGKPLQPTIDNIVAVSQTNCQSPNGIININATGASELLYSINGGTNWTSQYMFSSLGAGNYQVLVSFGNQTCPVAYSQNPIVLTVPSTPIINSVNSIAPSGCGNMDGSIIINASGANDLQYSINGGATWQGSGIFPNLSVGSYQIRVQNADGSCAVTGAPVLLSSSGSLPVIVNVLVQNPSSCNEADGYISVAASGTGTLQYSINNGFSWTTNPVFMDLNDGNYNLTVRSMETGCQAVYNMNPIQLKTPGCPGCLIEYELEVLPSGLYQVSMIPDTTWMFPFNITATAQVTIVAPTGGFFVANLTNLLPGVEFKDNVRVNAPIENPDYDYISFGLQTLGTQGIPYHQGVKVPLFTFENGGVCTGPFIFLMDDNTDPFAPPNSLASNAGQQLTTLGSNPDAPICIVQPNHVTCYPEMANQLNAVNDAFSGFVNQVIAGNVVVNDLNPGNNVLSVNTTPVMPPAHGGLVLNMDGIFNFQPLPGFVGIDQFQYLVCDDGLPAVCDVATVTLTVLPPFTVLDDIYFTIANMPVAGQVLANDNITLGVNPTFGVIAGAGPNNGTLVLNPNGSFQYSPNPGFIGTDYFKYASCSINPYQWCDTALVTIYVEPTIIANDDQYGILPGQTVMDNVLDNDILNGNNNVQVNLLPNSGTQHGTLTLQPNGVFTYQPNSGFIGNDSFHYIICDNSINNICDTAIAIISVTPGLVAIDDQYSTPAGESLILGLINNDILLSGSISTIFVLPGSYPSHGDVVLNPDLSVTYTPDNGYSGIEVFEYVICNNIQPYYCDTAIVTINIIPKLKAVDDFIQVFTSGTTTGTVLTNDINPNGNTLIVGLLPNTGPSNGDLILNPDGSYVYTPDPNFNGMDMFQYVVCDPVAQLCDTAKVTITVIPDLVAIDDYFNVLVGNNGNGNVLVNDQLPAGEAVTVNLIPGSGPQHGSVVVLPNGLFTYVPTTGFIGTDYFDYTVCLDDLPTICDTARVYITVYESAMPMPTILCPNKVCEGEDIVLSVIENYNGNSVSFEWVNALNQVVGNGQILTLASNNPNAVSPFRVKVTVDGNATDFSLPCGVEVVQAPMAVAYNNGPVCSGADVQLYANGGTGYHYNWRILGQPSILSSLQNPIISHVSQTTIYELTVTSEGCGLAATATTTVAVSQAPSIANITGGGTFCHGSEVILSATNAAPISGNIQYTWTGPNGFYFTANAPTIGPFPLILSTLVPENEGAYTLSLQSAQGCASNPQSIIVDYVPIPDAPQLTVNDPSLCQGETLVLNSSIAPAGVQMEYQWYFVGANGVAQDLGTTEAPTFELSNLTTANTGSYYLQITVDGCTSSLSNLQSITVSDANAAITATNSTAASSPVCEGAGVQLNADILPGAVYHWYGPIGFYANVPNPYIQGATEENAGEYLLILQVPGCNAAIALTTEVFVNPLPETPYLLNNGPVCEGADLTLSVANAEQGVTYDFFQMSTNQMVASTNGNYTIGAASMNMAGEYYVVASQSGCSSGASNMSMVEVDEMPNNLANGGNDIVLCGATGEIVLSATQPSNGVGQWTSLTGASIVNPDQPETLAEGLVLGENVFVWALSEGACHAFSMDTIVVQIEDIAGLAAFAGSDLQDCGATQVELSALLPNQGEGEWTQSLSQAAAGVNIQDPAEPNTLVTGLLPGQDYVFTWSISKGVCQNFSSDEVEVSIALLPDNQAVVLDGTVAVCDEDEVELVAQTPLIGNGQWQSLTGAAIANLSNPITTAFNLANGENVFVWSLSAPNCPDYSTDTMVVYNPALQLADDYLGVDANDSLPAFSVIGNDVLWFMDDWELTLVVPPLNGTAIYLGDGEFSYKPYTNAFGADQFTYMVCSTTCPDVCEMATVYLEINQLNVQPEDCFVPNTLTPNGDGQNDVLFVPCSASYPGSGITIYNRWGEVVYDKSDYQNDWGGTYNDEDVPVGTYFYLLKLNDDRKTVLSGYVVILR